MVGLQRGEELAPVLGVIERFFSVDVVSLGVHPSVVSTQRRAAGGAPRAGDGALLRAASSTGSASGPRSSCRALPPLFDLAQLDRLLVGLSDGEGAYTGLGYLEYVPEDGALRLISPVADPPKALRLGSVRLEESYRAKRVDLRNLFGTE